MEKGKGELGKREGKGEEEEEISVEKKIDVLDGLACAAGVLIKQKPLAVSVGMISPGLAFDIETGQPVLT